MELGTKLKQARLEAGLSQRQLCGDTITRNMLSQIENGSARPSMDTLAVLSARLGKTVSYFLEENAVTSPNQAVMEQARNAFRTGDFRAVDAALERYRAPDPVFDAERELLIIRALFEMAEEAIRHNRKPFATGLLNRIEEMTQTAVYYTPEEERRRLLLLARAQPKVQPEICRALPSLDEELLLRARDALDRGLPNRSGTLLDAAEDRESPEWNYLRGEVYLALKQFADAAVCYHRAESEFPEKTAAPLERCYRELEDYKQAYFYACKQR